MDPILQFSLLVFSNHKLSERETAIIFHLLFLASKVVCNGSYTSLSPRPETLMMIISSLLSFGAFDCFCDSTWELSIAGMILQSCPGKVAWTASSSVAATYSARPRIFKESVLWTNPWIVQTSRDRVNWAELSIFLKDCMLHSIDNSLPMVIVALCCRYLNRDQRLLQFASSSATYWKSSDGIQTTTTRLVT